MKTGMTTSTSEGEKKKERRRIQLANQISNDNDVDDFDRILS